MSAVAFRRHKVQAVARSDEIRSVKVNHAALYRCFLITLRLHHKTTYRYRVPVGLGLHRLMLRPRGSHELRLISNDVVVTPAATITLAQDVCGNPVATASFQAMADTFVIESTAEIDLDTIAVPRAEGQAPAQRPPNADICGRCSATGRSCAKSPGSIDALENASVGSRSISPCRSLQGPR